MSLTEGFHRILDAGLDWYEKPVYTEIAGVPVRYHTGENDEWEDWQVPLEFWLPIFEEHGLTRDLERIIIDEGLLKNYDGEYLNRRIYANTNPCPMFQDTEGAYISWGTFGGPLAMEGQTVSGTREYIILHELWHHVDLHLNDNKCTPLATDDETYIKANVSLYAGKNRGEFICEMATAILLGQDFPDKVHDLYEEYCGPEIVYEIRETC